MFRSLAGAWGSAAVAVVLSGALDDGAAGALAIAQAGGRVIVQDPEDALVPGDAGERARGRRVTRGRPGGRHGGADRQARGNAVSGRAEEADVSTEPDPAEMERGPNRPDGPRPASPAPSAAARCGSCATASCVRYRCRVGHSYSEDAMVDAQGTAVEAALWTALEVLEERSELLRRMAKRMESAAAHAAALRRRRTRGRGARRGHPPDPAQRLRDPAGR